MGDDVSNIIATVNPKRYQDYKTPKELASFKKILKSEKFSNALKAAKAKAIDEHNILYDSSSETLEPIYFWILDFMNDMFGGKVEKIVDNFTSSPGSGHFSELMGKATRMQEEGAKLMQTIGVLIKSLINIIYDLRQFELRFNDYDAAHSKDSIKAEAGLMALKQIWMDSVDMKRGNTSIKAMTFSQSSFATLIDGFMVAKTEKNVKQMDLNDRVKRVLIQKIHEFNKWKELSEKELRKRYEVERSWLKSQVNSLKLYSRWAKPYFKAAEELTMDSPNAAIVKAFNTIYMELTIFGKNKINVEEEAFDKNIPIEFKNIKTKRDYFACVLVSFKFRGVPQRAGQHYVFGGRADVKFQAYALNQDELDLMQARLDESDISEALKLIQGATEESLDQMKEDLDYFLKDEGDRELESVQKAESNDVNPFSALLGLGNSKTKKVTSVSKDVDTARIDKLKTEGVKPDNYKESVLRSLAESNARENCFSVFNIYKKAHGMVNHPTPEEYEGEFEHSTRV